MNITEYQYGYEQKNIITTTIIISRYHATSGANPGKKTSPLSSS